MVATRCFETPVPNYQTNGATSLKTAILFSTHNKLVRDLSHKLEALLLIKILYYRLYRWFVPSVEQRVNMIAL